MTAIGRLLIETHPRALPPGAPLAQPAVHRRERYRFGPIDTYDEVVFRLARKSFEVAQRGLSIGWRRKGRAA